MQILSRRTVEFLSLRLFSLKKPYQIFSYPNMKTGNIITKRAALPVLQEPVKNEQIENTTQRSSYDVTFLPKDIKQ